MPGHSYSGSSASGNSAAVFPPTPVASLNEGDGLYQLTVTIASCPAGRPTFEGWTSYNGVGNPADNPGNWVTSGDDGPFDDALNYVEEFENDQIFFIGRSRYGLNVSGWSNITFG